MPKQVPCGTTTTFRILDQQRNVYVFSIMANHFTAPTDEIREGISTLIRQFQKKQSNFHARIGSHIQPLINLNTPKTKHHEFLGILF